ncbi:hypothetical protein DSO57_1032040 [Entomophthora muscae]|uniref:Uncharacterized protein n=1 Tax=Entomophthora muscae TaxID=34485 RepID=A0ACC2S2D9_9FUNG|nr:hypothetical protein DSO57_1032040 [Entomophthora muscae]
MKVQCFLFTVVACSWSIEKFEATVNKIALRELVVPKPRVVPCNQIHKHLGQGNCHVFRTNETESYISPLRALYLLEPHFQKAKEKLADGFDKTQVVMKKDPKCRVVVNKPESLGGPQMDGFITISEESAKQTDKGLNTMASVSYSTPGSFLAGVTVTLSTEYHKSIATSTSSSVGQKLMITNGTVCTPTLAYYSILCDPVSKIFFLTNPNTSLTISQNKGDEGVFLPLSSHAPKFFSAAVGCVSTRREKQSPPISPSSTNIYAL